MYCFESRLEVSDEETPHALGSEDGFQYIQHEAPNKSRCQMKLNLIRGACAIIQCTYYYVHCIYIMLQVKIKLTLKVPIVTIVNILLTLSLCYQEKWL